MSNLIDEIRTARQLLRDEENRTHDAAIELQNCKQRERKAKAELDALLDELETGQSRYPLPGFDRLEIGDPTTDATQAAAVPVRLSPPRGGRRKAKGA